MCTCFPHEELVIDRKIGQFLQAKKQGSIEDTVTTLTHPSLDTQLSGVRREHFNHRLVKTTWTRI